MVALPRLKALRMARALSQVELAQRAGLRRQTILRLEQGRLATMRTVRALADALGVEPIALMEP